MRTALDMPLLALALVSASCSSSGEDPPVLVAEPEIVVYPEQPMVVDVIVTTDRPAVVSIEHLDDPGVVAAVIASEDDGRRQTVRVRGLAPVTDHELALQLGEGEDATTHPLTFTSEFQLPGFRPSFDVEVHDVDAVDGAYRLFDYAYTPLWIPTGIYAIDPDGTARWYCGDDDSPMPGPTSPFAGITLRADGSLLSVRDGAVVVVDELCRRALELPAADHGLADFHHDAIELPSGNFLTIGNSFRTVDYPDLGPILVAGDLLVELDPAGQIVWTWDAFDHLDPQRRRAAPEEGLPYHDPVTGQPGYDWTHGNGVIHRADDDMLLLSMRHQDWLIAIDHQTGEIVWRLGPEGDFDLLAGTWFFRQHSPQWQDDGSLLVYDNALGNPDVPFPELATRAVRYELDESAMTATQVWDDGAEQFLAPVAGDADRMPGGNVLILDSSLQPDPSEFDVGQNYSRLREITPDGDPVWTLTTKLGSLVYRATASVRLPGEASAADSEP